MNYSFRQKNLAVKILSSVVYDLPAPVNLSFMWNFGSLAGTCLVIQILTGLFLVMHYSPDVDLAFFFCITYCSGWIMDFVKSIWL